MRLSLPSAILGLVLGSVLGNPALAAPDKMQAVEVAPDGTLSVQTRPVPQPGAGEVLIRVRAAGVNPVDWKIASRRVGLVPGTDVAGTIDAVGEGVSGFAVGDAVLGFARTSGSYAEFAVVPVNSLAKKSKTLSFEQAAGVPIVGETAYRALHEAGRIKSGQTVLIHGAAGGVGSAAVQIAKAAGARVIGTASPNNHEFLKSLGADQVIDYRSQRFEDVVRNVDLVLNTVDAQTATRSLKVLREGGTLVSVAGAPDAAGCAAAKIHCTRPNRDTGPSNADVLARLMELADAGKFSVNVDEAFSMADAVKAWQKSRAGHTRGKLIIKVNAGPTMKHQ
jgi:NADPH:quinone reductase-like Zn-dependent oxidoreductase